MVDKVRYDINVLIEVAWIHEWLLMSNSYPHHDFDSEDAKVEIVRIAKEFIKKNPENVYNLILDEIKRNYFDEVLEFAEEELMKWNKENYIS